ncbi:MAG: hypothetical protein JJU11_10205 [Candidatus Sumerlaeia bacterium]|nr:hypothetical protein [Candidatus Sumerlaeia bacterium]
MRNCLVLGSGRSGTSTVAGILAGSGYDPGGDLIEAHEGNPKGFFESDRVNQINDRIIAHLRGGMAMLRGKPDLDERAMYWLHGSPRLEVSGALASRLLAWRCAGEMKEIIAGARRPFCLKDPRFSYTLGPWRSFLPEDTQFIVTFRHPSATAHSVAKFYKKPEDPGMLRIGMEHFISCYGNILEIHRHSGRWLFIHYRQLLDGSAVPAMESFLEADLKGDFVEPALNRSAEKKCDDQRAMELYDRLCELADSK